MRLSILIAILLLLAEGQAQQPPWSGILDPSRAIDWTQTHPGVYINGVAGIPTGRAQCIPPTTSTNHVVNGVVMPSGSVDYQDVTNINAALQYCGGPNGTGNQAEGAPGGLYLQLGAGTFNLVNSITFGGSRSSTTIVNKVTMRGMGPDQTKLVVLATGNAECGVVANAICFSSTPESVNSQFYPPNGGACTWDAGYAKGSTVLTLNNCGSRGMPPQGTHIVLDQRADDVGLTGCSSSGTTATCTLSVVPSPSPFQVGACVGIGSVPSGTNVLSPQLVDGTTLPAWAASTAYAVNAQIRDSNGNVQQVVTAGTSGATAPSWSNVPGISTNAASQTHDGTGALLWRLISNYNGPATLPIKNPTDCNQITSVSGANFSYTLRFGQGNLATITCTLSSACWATVDTKSIYVTAVAGATITDGNAINGRACPDASTTQPPFCQQGPPQEISRRPQAQVVTVKSVSGNQITIDQPLYNNNWRASQAPGVWWFTSAAYHFEDGIENLSIDSFNNGGAQAGGVITFWQCYNCWVRNVRSLSGDRNHVWIRDGSAHITVRDSYFWGTKRGASQSYGVEQFGLTSDVLVENNLFEHVVGGLMDGGAVGAVEDYNYMTDDGYGQNVIWMMAQDTPNHDINAYTLHEGNNSSAINFDSNHGNPSGPITMFRNRSRGQNLPAKFNQLYAFQASSRNRGINAIGGVLGTIGVITSTTTGGFYDYQGLTSTTIGCNLCIYYLGQQTQSVGYINDDALTRSTMMRWGNWDAVTAQVTPASNGIRWCGIGSESGCSPYLSGTPPQPPPGVSASGTEIPGAGSAFLNANTVPASQTVPASFYLPGQPSWWTTKWGTSPWPAIGPDVTGGPSDYPSDPPTYSNGGHTFLIPSQWTYQKAPLDTVYAKTYAITSGSYTATPPSPTGCPGGGPTITLTGAFPLSNADTFTVQGAVPVAYNGTYMVCSSDGMNPGGAPSISVQAVPGGGSGMAYATYRIAITRVRVGTPSGETAISTTQTQGATTSSTCPGSGSCQITVTSPCGASTNLCTGGNAGNNGTFSPGGQPGTHYNVYVQIQSSVSSTSQPMCLQNSSPIPLGTNYVQNVPVQSLANPPCVLPPTLTTLPASTINIYVAGDPGGAMTTLGTLTAPLVKVFNADQYYYGAAPPPQPPTASMSVNPTSITVGQSATLTWLTSNANTVSITPIGTVAASGSQSVSPSVTTTYTLAATNVNGTTNATAVLTVGTTPPPTTSPSTIQGVGVIQGQGVIKQP